MRRDCDEQRTSSSATDRARRGRGPGHAKSPCSCSNLSRTVRLRQAWQAARAGLGLDADRRMWPELAERAADDGWAGRGLKQREGADSGQPVAAAATVQAEQHAVGAETRNEPRGRG